MKKETSAIRRIYPSSTIMRLEKKKNLLGLNNNYNIDKFLLERLLITIIIFILCFFFWKNGFILAPILSILFYISIEYLYFDINIKKRGKKLEEEAIFFFEVLSLTLESGRSLNSSLAITSQNIESELSQEFQKSLKEMHLGKSFTECMNDMKERIPSETINNALLNITQSSIFGNDISESLNNQLEFLREKRILEIKAEISKLPTKISIISVLFIIPIMLLVILSPVVLELLFG